MRGIALIGRMIRRHGIITLVIGSTAFATLISMAICYSAYLLAGFFPDHADIAFWLPILVPLTVATPMHSLIFLVIDRIVRLREEVVIRSQALDKALQQARHANELQRQFLTVLSQDFRRPLTVLDVTLRWIDGAIPAGDRDVAHQKLDAMRAAVRQMGIMVDEVLRVAALDSGTLVAQWQQANLGQILQIAVEQAVPASRNHPMDIHLPTEPVSLTCDPVLLQMAFFNILGNAVRYSPVGTAIAVALVRQGGQAVVTILDHGIGIPAAELPHVFDRFFRGQDSLGTPGTGLGLHLARGIVELHGGSIDVASRVGEGTQVLVRLPLSGT